MTFPPGRRVLPLLFTLLVAVATVIADDAEARRLGGGRSIGRQSSNVSQREAPAPQNSPSQGQSASNPSQGQQAGNAPQQPPRNRWLGPVAGLAAGLGIAALMSHFGLGGALGEMMGSFLLVAVLVIAGIFTVRMLKGARGPSGTQPAYAGGSPRPPVDATVTPLRRETAAPVFDGRTASGPVSVTGEPLAPLRSDVPAGAATWTIPAGFDVDGFVRSAKVYFVRLQAAWDAGDLADIREFTTPEMFAEIRLDLADRGTARNQTDVIHVDAQLLGLEDQGTQTLASVRFTGTLKEDPAADAAPFREVWNLVKPARGRDGWLLAGIQQEPA
ncbi:MAG: TIM44-like domain-containing protein [Burkholderiales bacterium]